MPSPFEFSPVMLGAGEATLFPFMCDNRSLPPPLTGWRDFAAGMKGSDGLRRLVKHVKVLPASADNLPISNGVPCARTSAADRFANPN